MNRNIELNDVSKSIKKHQILTDVSMSIDSGEIFGLLGPSGCGKTTTVKVISGLLSADSGSVKLLGRSMPDESVMSRIGYMAQAAALYDTLTGRENLEFFGKMYGFKGSSLTGRTDHVTSTVGLGDKLSQPVSTYSGGMKQRLSLAIALLPSPEVLLLDEPTVGIDPVLRMSIWKELRGLADDGAAILITTHVMDEAAKCDRLGMMRAGKLIAVGTPDELIERSGTKSIEEAFIYFGGSDHEN